MAFRPLPELAFSFARFVAREYGCSHFRRWNFRLAAVRHRNFGRRFQRRRNRNGGLCHRRTVLGAPRRHYGPGGGLRRRHNHRQHYHHVQRHHFAGTTGPSIRTIISREEVQAIPAEATVVPEVIAVAPQFTAVQEVAAELVAAELVDAEYQDEASASKINAGADELLPPPPAFMVPPMEWLLGGPSAGWLVDDPEREFSDDELETPRRLMCYFKRHGNGQCMPSPTPSDEDPEHFAPSGCDPVTEFFQPLFAVPVDASPAAIPNINLPAEKVEEEKNEDAAPSLALPTPSQEARVLLRCFDSAMAARPAGTGRGTRFPEALDLTGRVAELRLNEAAHHSSSSAEWPSRRW